MPSITISIVTLAFYSRERLAALPYGATARVIGVISLGFDNHRSRRSFFFLGLFSICYGYQQLEKPYFPIR